MRRLRAGVPQPDPRVVADTDVATVGPTALAGDGDDDALLTTVDSLEQPGIREALHVRVRRAPPDPQRVPRRESRSRSACGAPVPFDRLALAPAEAPGDRGDQ